MIEHIEITEWETRFLENVELSDFETVQLAKILSSKGILEVTELKKGIQISSNSYVGRIKLGELQINISPKLSGLPLYKLMRYTYGLKALKRFHLAEHNIDDFSFFDLLIYELYVEAEILFYRGMQKNYLLKEDNLFSPKGKIHIEKLCRRGGTVESTLPCRFFERAENHILNQMLLAGLRLSLNLVLDLELKRKIQKICHKLESRVETIFLSRRNLNIAGNSINRLTSKYETALEIINILYESHGIQAGGAGKLDLLGYFFDMNIFFENVVGRILENCPEGYSVKGQYNLKEMFLYRPDCNLNRKKSPTPRPDFALMYEGEVVKLMDAKYRDLWGKSLPSNMLYQLAIYAISGVGKKQAVILYPALDGIPTLQTIDINDPVSGIKIASVLLHPLNLCELANSVGDKEHIKEYVASFISLTFVS